MNDLMPLDDYLYHYKAIVTKVYDGDTITVDIDLGLGVWRRGEKLRLYGLNAPEVRGSEREAGLRARHWLREILLERRVYVSTIKDRTGKYGRLLAYVYYYDRVGKEHCVNVDIVDAGHAEPVEY